MNPSSKDKLYVYDMLSKAFKNEKVSFHMPGHNKLKSYPRGLRRKLLLLDTTELDVTDNLNNPANDKAFQKALNYAQSAFSSAKTFFVTTGASGAIHAAIFALTSQGDKIIAYNNSHQSLINACIMFNLKLVFTDQETLSTTIKEHPDAKLVFATYPDYKGKCIDLNNLVSYSRNSKMNIIIDESHGTHLKFAPNLLPPSALDFDVDIVIHSAHKTTPALTQGAFLHVTKSFTNKASNMSKNCLLENISNSISIVGTSSPSFVIGASLEYSVYYLSQYGCSKISKLFKNINYFVKLLPHELKPIISKEYHNFILGEIDPTNLKFDFTKLVLDFKSYNFSTKEVNDHLKNDGINIEYKDYRSLVLLCNMENTKSDFRKLSKSLKNFIVKQKKVNKNLFEIENKNNLMIESKLSKYFSSRVSKINTFKNLSDSKFHCEYIPLNKSLNKISYSSVTPYPPGIPLLIPGQIISKDCVDLINLLLDSDITVNGVDSSSENQIKCIK